MQAPPNHVSMMQIDCEVMNTRLLHIKEDAIPIHMTAQMKPTTVNSSLQRNESNSHETDNNNNATASAKHSEQFEEFAQKHRIYEMVNEDANEVVATVPAHGKVVRAERRAHAKKNQNLYKRRRTVNNVNV